MRCEWFCCKEEGKERIIYGFSYNLCDLHYSLLMRKHSMELKALRDAIEELNRILAGKLKD